MSRETTGNWLTDILVSLIVAWLTRLFAELADLIGRIEAGQYQPRPATERSGPDTARPRQRNPLARTQDWPHAMPPDPAGHPSPPDIAPPAPRMVSAPAPLGGIPCPCNPPACRPGLTHWAIARLRGRNHPEKAHPRLAPWHGHFVTLS
jgi:hypothetical protein